MSCGLYFPSWSCLWTSSAADCPISKLKLKYPQLTHVFMAFSKPDLSYTKNSFLNTGLEFSSDFNVIRDAIKFLRTQKVLVFLSVGGGSYWNSRQFFNISATINLANDLEVDGIDIDYESTGDGTELTSHLINLRSQYSKKIFFAGWSTGAFPRDGAYSGSAIDALKKVGHLIDGVNIMAYDAGPNFSPQISFSAYRALYGGTLLLGFLVGQPGWGGYFLTVEDVKRDSHYISQQSNSGIFIWCEGKIGTPSPHDIFAINSQFTKPPLPLPSPPPISLQCPVCKSTFIKK